MQNTSLQGIVRTTSGRPWHLWLVGILSLLWYASGALTIVLAQLGSLPDIKPDEAEYYAAQAPWFVIATDLSLISAVAGSFALLLRHSASVWLFAVSLASIILTNCYDLIAGTSRVYANTGAAVVTCIIVVWAVLVLLYSFRMQRQ